jgi:sugar (pentulose or hexulose) kinase
VTSLFVGIDVGTTRVKALAVDQRGDVCGESERPTPWRHGRDGRAEIDPPVLSRLAYHVADRAAAGPLAGAGRRVAGIGVTGMAETGVLVDGRDRPLGPAIAWHDPRGEVDTIARELPAFETTTGLPLSPLPTLAKLLWLRRNRPETKGAVRFYSVGEWVVRAFGGDAVAELSLGSRTGLVELATGRPWDEAFALLDAPPLLPAPVVAGTPAGRAGGEAVPAALRGAVLTVAGHDHQVAAYGLGAATDGALLDSLGTAEALVRTVRSPLAPPRVAALTAAGVSVGWGVVADHLCVLAGLWTGLTLDRLATMLGVVTGADRAALGERALATPGDHPTLRLVDPRGEHVTVAGITDGVTPAVLWRAAVDGLVAESGRVLDSIEAVTGPHREVVVVGGWLRHPALLAAKRRQFPAMRTTAVSEPGAYGAALLAAVAAGEPVRERAR